MNRYLLILLLLSIQLFAFSDKTFIRVKANTNDNLVKMEVIIFNPMIDTKLAKRRNRKVDFITRFIAKVNNKIVYEVHTGIPIAENPYIRFQFQNPKNNKTIKLEVTDNNGTIKYISLNLKNLINKRKKYLLNHLETKPLNRAKIWNIEKMEKAINDFSENKSFIHSDKLQVKLPKSSIWTFSVGIKSDLELKSIAIFENSTTDYSAVAIIIIHPESIIDFKLKIRMRLGCDKNVVVIAKGKNGEVYRTDKTISIGGGDINCDGTSTGGGG